MNPEENKMPRQKENKIINSVLTGVHLWLIRRKKKWEF
jgi:hypothetical protein